MWNTAWLFFNLGVNCSALEKREIVHGLPAIQYQFPVSVSFFGSCFSMHHQTVYSEHISFSQKVQINEPLCLHVYTCNAEVEYSGIRVIEVFAVIRFWYLSRNWKKDCWQQFNHQGSLHYNYILNRPRVHALKGRTLKTKTETENGISELLCTS